MAKKAWDTPEYRKMVESTAKALTKAGKPAPLSDAWYGRASGGPRINAPVGGSGAGKANPWGSINDPGFVIDRANDNAKEILRKRGLKESDLDETTRKALANANRADAQSIAMGAERKKEKSWWMKGLDIISRPLYGSAEGARQGFNEAADPTKDDNALKDLFDTAKGFGRGFGQGFTGKEKTTFSDVIQRVADAKHAADTGKKFSEIKEGSAKVNPWLKYGVGLTADIALDPTTYMGFGLATKGLAGKKALQQIEDTGKAVQSVKAATKLGDKAHEVTASHLAPVENLSKRKIAKLSPEGQEVANVARAFQKDIGAKNVRKLRKAKGADTAYLGTKVTGTDVRVKSILAALEEGGTKVDKKLINLKTVDDLALDRLAKEYPALKPELIKADRAKGLTLEGAIRSHVPTNTDDVFAKFQGHRQEALLDLEKKYNVKLGENGRFTQTATKTTKIPGLPGITETMLKNASPAVKKQVALRMGGAYLPLPGVATGASKIGAVAMKADPIKASVTKFNDLFRAKAGINPALHGIRNEATGGLGQRVIHYAKNLRSIYDEVPKESRKGVLSSYRNGALDGNMVEGGLDLATGGKVKVLKHFAEEIKRMSGIVDSYKFLPEDLNEWLPKAYHAPALKRAGTEKGGASRLATTEDADWLVNHVKTSNKFNDAGLALHHINAAVEQLVAKRSMDETIAETFGVKKAHSVGSGGKKTAQYSEQTKALKAKGWREVDVDHLKGYLFDPDVAHGIERMNDVFRSRQAVDGFAHTVEKATSEIKALMTIYNPGFHPRTMMGEVLLNYLGGMPAHIIPNAYRKAAQVMHGRDRELLGDARTALETKTQGFKDRVAKLPNGFGEAAASDKEVISEMLPFLNDTFKNAPPNGVFVEKAKDGTRDGFHIAKKVDGQVVAFISGAAKPENSDDLFRWTHPNMRGQGLQKELNEVASDAGMDVNSHLLKAAAEGKMGFSKAAADSITSGPGLKLSRSQMRTANILHGGQTTTQAAGQVAAGHKPIIKWRGKGVSADQLWHAYLNSGVKSGYASSDLMKAGADKALLGKGVRKAGEKVHNVSEFVEDTGRMAQFIYEVSKSRARTLDEAFKEAAQKVTRSHLDYTAVTRTEHKISAYGIPFYKWLRLSTPLMIDILLHNPGRALNVPKGLSAMSKALGYDEGQGQGLFPAEPDIMTPSFLRGHGAYPMFGGNTHYFDPTSLFPVAGSVDLLNFEGNAGDSTAEKLKKSAYDRMNPLITKPFDLGKYEKQSQVDWLAGTVPQTNLAKNLIKQPDPDISNLERLMMFLGNPGFVSNTPKKVRGEIYKERDASYKNRKVRKQELGIDK